MSIRPPRIALYGGSFDPPHLAHVLAVAGVLSAEDVDGVWVLPVFRHPLTKQPTSWSQRLALCEAAFGLFGDAVQVRQDEADLNGTGRTLDLITYLQAAHPDTTFRLMIGSDQLTNRHRWHRFDEVCRLAPPIVLGRPDHPTPAPFEVAFELPDMSSTAARTALQRGHVPSWLPREVRRRIRADRLYGLSAFARGDLAGQGAP